MKTRYKIPIIIISILLGILFIPLIASNLYCDFLGDSCTSRITGVGPGGVYLPVEWGTVDNCWIDNGNGTLEPCRIDIAQIKWPHTPSFSIPERQCDEICLDNDFPENQKIKSEDERKNFCESQEGQWSDEFNNCIGGSMEVSCDYVSTSEFKPPNVFSKIMNQDGTCTSHEFFCKSMGGNSACMSYEQMGHGREICIAVCGFD